MRGRIALSGAPQERLHTDNSWSPVATLGVWSVRNDLNQSRAHICYLLLDQSASTREYDLLYLGFCLHDGGHQRHKSLSIS